MPVGVESTNGRFLDIGAADRWIEASAPVGLQYVALDYPATGRDMYGGRPDVFANAEQLPFPDESFDGVACLEVLEHVRDPAAVMGEIRRVLRHGGQAWISMPFLYPLHDEPFDFQRYTAHGLQRDIRNAGLELMELRRTGHAVRSAGLLASLAVAGGLNNSRGLARWLILPAAIALVPLINLMAWVGSLLLPDWEPMTAGYEVRARKP